MTVSLRLRALAALTLGALALPDSSPAMDRLRYQSFPELEGKPVRQVLILGNNATREHVFRREMMLSEGETFRSDLLWRDWENLVDLGLFAQIEVDAVPSADGVMVVVSVQERPRWLISPVFDYDFADEQITYGYRLRVRNLGGLNQSFTSDGRLGGRDNVGFSWETPWLGATRRNLSASLLFELPPENIYELRTSQLTLASTNYLGDYRQHRRGFTNFVRLAVVERDEAHPEGSLNQLVPSIGAAYFRDTRNVRIDPTRGSLLSATSEYATSWTAGGISYLRNSGDARAFLSLGERFVIAGRANTVLSTGEVPLYRRVAVGGSSSIRGQPPNAVIGENLARASMELRFGLMSTRRFNLPIPLVPGRIKNFDLRFDGVIFADAGTAWGPVPLRDSELKQGFGVGLRIFLPVLEVAGLELSFDENGSPTLYFREGNII
ncbi:MAG: BamA/TamA family outer membrane protein [Candidatus Eiseniibacteriota bacterium]